MLPLLADNIFPIFLTAGVGWLLGMFTKIDRSTVSRLAFHVLSPALIFDQITSNQIPNEAFATMMLFAIVVTFAVGVLTWGLGLVLGFRRKLLAAVVLVSMLPNAGNYGLSVNLFAFGESGLAHASIYFVTMAILTYTVGVVIASMGTKSLKEAVTNLFRTPVLYALVAAFIFNQFHLSLPLPLGRSVGLLSGGAIPIMLILLGLQLQRVMWNKDLFALGVANLSRLVVSPFIAVGLSAALSMDGIAQQAGILEAGMPSAVMTIILATEFDLEPGFVTTAVTTSTLFSVLSVTAWLAFLGA